ncbi:LPS assembly lipoprotein LptE [Oligoflexus tunisiensis]|uniref:LPS assembly lipoprotein LptE n=1 Tax=Oligoflexus tunisiensis TaxID=708132 RepID=UPI00114CFFB9|nr:LPS assembly lipoprotein LptE [Oligoflexus tunisiensis]
MSLLIVSKPLSRIKMGGICLLLFALNAGCVYRFSNTALRPPVGVRTIAVEAVYDVSREVIPHELLWSAVQRELARSGRLMVTSQDEADAIMLITLNRASVNPTGTPSREAINRDPVVTETEKPAPGEFRNLKRAGNRTTDEAVNMTINVEVHDLKTRAVLFTRNYSAGTTFKSLRSETITPASSAYLNYEEALQAKVKELSAQLASRIVADFLM